MIFGTIFYCSIFFITIIDVEQNFIGVEKVSIIFLKIGSEVRQRKFDDRSLKFFESTKVRTY